MRANTGANCERREKTKMVDESRYSDGENFHGGEWIWGNTIENKRVE